MGTISTPEGNYKEIIDKVSTPEFNKSRKKQAGLQ